ncbi:hypothetical protein T09_4061, partial [Trichinella sp. T9]
MLCCVRISTSSCYWSEATYDFDKVDLVEREWFTLYNMLLCNNKSVVLRYECKKERRNLLGSCCCRENLHALTPETKTEHPLFEIQIHEINGIMPMKIISMHLDIFLYWSMMIK